MKPNHMGVHAVVPLEAVHRMARLNGGNRTKTVNAAIETYLSIQGAPVNRYGVDCHYFREKLMQLVSRIDSYTPEELSRALGSLSNAASACDREAINEQV